MSGTLLSVPTLGDSDWSPWITLVDACRRGYLAASYTNFAASAESALAAGSLVEVAGAVYSFTETAIDYTGGGSVNSDLYIYVKPDAVVSTATVVAWGSAPVWVDAKQGFYASAASTTRCIGGIYVATAATYYNKYLYEGDNLTYCLQANATRPILKKVVEIGDWDMDATHYVSIAHGLIASKIRNVHVAIRVDEGTNIQFGAAPVINNSGVLVGEPANLAYYAAIFAININRLAGGLFDDAAYNATSYNRGYVYIEYEA